VAGIAPVAVVRPASSSGDVVTVSTPVRATSPSDGGRPPGREFASEWRRQRLTVEDRTARGRAERLETPRSLHARWTPAPDRPDPIALLEQQALTRVPELVPIRYGRMLVSPFTFFRGCALIMAADLVGSPRSGVTVQLCGDAHLSNFGLFGTPERKLLFDVNDFDETLPGPWEWDIKRLAASFEVRAGNRGVDSVDGELRIVADPPIIVPVEEFVVPGTAWTDPTPVIKKLLASYRRTLTQHHHPLEEHRYVHAARKVVGVGSVGTRCWIVLLMGRDDRDPLYLQVKEAGPSVLEGFLGPMTYRHHGQRVVAGQRLMRAATDIFLGWQRINGLDGVTRDYYVRQFHDWKGSADVDTMDVRAAMLYSRICGATLGRSHAR
jgi:hypothetical protein